MYKPKFFIFALLFLFGSTAVFAQTDDRDQVEPGFEILLQVIVASNNSGEKSELPPALSGVIKKLKTDYSYSNYKLAAAFVERMSANGVIGHTGILNQLGQTRDNMAYFSDWGLSGLRSGKNAKGQDFIHFQTFNFGARVPVVTANAKGGETGIVNYESIGLKITRFNLPENTPTLIGSMATPKPDEFIFLVLTVKSAG